MNHGVTAVIPAHNAREYIREALDSVAAQELPAHHVIVVDDGSTDDTAQQVRDWRAERGLGVQLIVQGNAGPAAARNVGIRLARSEFVALLDADDLWLPHHLDTLLPSFDQAPEAVLSFGDQQEFGDEANTDTTFLADKAVHQLDYDELPGGGRLLKGSVYMTLAGGSYIPTSGMVFRRSTAERIGLFDVSPALMAREDREFLLRMSRAGGFVYHPAVVARKRVHQHNITHPRHSLSLNETGLEVALKMTRSAATLRLSPPEVERTRQGARAHAKSLLYLASLQGPRTYTSACVRLVRRGVVRPVLNPKHMLRSLRHARLPAREAAS